MSTTATYSVTGMTCSHCVAAVTEEVSRLDGVSAVDVDLNAGGDSRVTVTSTGSRNVEPVPGSGTWTGTGGRLTASCEGNAISLGGAVPADGYWAKPYERGPDRLRVDFESKDDDDRTEVRVYAVCVDGRPEFRHE